MCHRILDSCIETQSLTRQDVCTNIVNVHTTRSIYSALKGENSMLTIWNCTESGIVDEDVEREVLLLEGSDKVSGGLEGGQV